MNKSIILYCDIPQIAKNNDEKYFNGYTYALLRYGIITKKELEVVRQHYPKLAILGDDDYRTYLEKLEKVEDTEN